MSEEYNDNSDADENIIDQLIDYLLECNWEKVMSKLRERQMIPRLPGKYNLAALLCESGI